MKEQNLAFGQRIILFFIRPITAVKQIFIQKVKSDNLNLLQAIPVYFSTLEALYFKQSERTETEIIPCEPTLSYVLNNEIESLKQKRALPQAQQLISLKYKIQSIGDSTVLDFTKSLEKFTQLSDITDGNISMKLTQSVELIEEFIK